MIIQVQTSQQAHLMRQLLLIFAVFSLFDGGIAHAVRQVVNSAPQKIHAYVGQAKSVAIPFQKCFKAQPQLPIHDYLIHFEPTRLGLSPQAKYPLASAATQTPLLTELRSPVIHKHTQILRFQGYLMALHAPNNILIVKEEAEGFKLVQQYHLQDLKPTDQLKLYPLGQKAIGVIYGQKRAYLLDHLGYTDVAMPHPSSIIHLVAMSEQEFVGACFQMGLIHYRLNPTGKKVDIVKQYRGKELGLGQNSFKYVVDVNLEQLKKGVILALDAWLGVVEVPVGADTSSTARVLVSQKMCQSFDTIEQDHIVLLCQNQGHSTIIQAYRSESKSKKGLFRTLEPVFHWDYLNDLHVTWNFYLVYSFNSLHVFWNTHRHRLPETLQTQSQIPIDGLETFTIHTEPDGTIIYTIEDGQLHKYSLYEKRAQLTLQTAEPIDTLLKVFFYGSCEDLSLGEEQDGNVQACKVVKEIAFQADEEDKPRQGDIGISATIIGILVVVFLIIIWICLTKYKTLQREARKILEGYQRRKSRGRQRI